MKFQKILDFLKKNKLLILLIIFLLITVYLFSLKKEKFTISPSSRELVFFSMKGCGHCEDFKPVWDLLYKNYGNTYEIELKQVVAHEKPDIVKQYNITGFPTILALKDGKINMEYKGDRSYEDLVRFMNHAMTD